jgi:OFA family oxalate/formate antiporter-like MFS transporter
VNVNNRWFQLCASLIAMVMIGNLQYTWTLFVEPIRAGTGWKLSDIQWAFSLFIFCQTWVQPLDGWVVDRLGPRTFIAAAGVLCGLGWAGMGFAQSPTLFYVLYAAAGVGAAFVYSTSIGSALKWFKARRGLASGIMAAGFAAGTALFLPLMNSLIRSQGYRGTFMYTGLLQGLVILGVSPFLRHPPEQPAAARSSAVSATTSAAAAQRQYSTLEMLRTPRFYLLYTAFVLVSTGGLLVTAQAGPIAKTWGFAQGTLLLATSLGSLANGFSRVFWGWISDRRGRELTMAVAFGLQAVSLLLLLTVGPVGPGWFASTFVFTYFTYGEIFSLFPSAVGDYFGTRHATSNNATLYTAKGVSALILAGGPAAMLFEQFGNWSAVFYISVGMALVASMLVFTLRGASVASRAAIVVPATAK